MEAYSLFEVNQYIRRVLALNFEEPIWVECEINQISQTRGNTYLDLIQKKKDSEDVIAKSSATIWYRQLIFIRKKLGKLADEILSSGIKVKLKVTIEFSERYGLSFNILDIDPSYTFGQYELNRQQIIQKLSDEQLLDKNAQLRLPSVIKKIAVISSETAAGYKDFMTELVHNPYGYTFQTELFQAAMQGQNTEREVSMALNTVSDDFDVIVLIRGGGSKLDLSAFDNYNISLAIAKNKLPVITGIGHEIDQTVCDIVSHTSLKTPTAVAGFVIERNMNFEAELDYMMEEINHFVSSSLSSIKQELTLIQNNIVALPKMIMREKQLELKNLQLNLFNIARQVIQNKHRTIESMNDLMEVLEPAHVLKRGFTLVKSKDKYITRREQLNNSNESITVEFFDGEIELKK